MQSLGITDSHYMRTRGAARTSAAPRDLDPAVSPTLTVGATHEVARRVFLLARALGSVVPSRVGQHLGEDAFGEELVLALVVN